MKKIQRAVIFTKKRWELILLGIIVIFYALVFSSISIVNHDRFQTFGWDLGFYDQVAWQLSRFEFPVSSIAGAPAFGIRFSPILVIFSPLYWLWGDAKVLLIGQAVLAAAAAIPVYLFSKKITKSKVTAVAIAFSYSSFIGLHRAVFFDFHPDTIMPFFIAWLYWFAVNNNKKAAILFSVLVLLHKEWAGLLVFGIGLMFFWNNRKRKRIGLAVAALGIIGFVSVIYGVAIPLAGKETPIFNYGEVGSTPVEVVRTTFTKPWVIVKSFVVPSAKLKTLFNSLWPFSFLPILSPVTLIPAFVHFGLRFLDASHQQSWTLKFHYSAPIAVLLSMSCAYSLAKLKNNKVLVALLFLTTVGHMFYFHSPVFSIIKPEFYSYKTSWIGNNHELLRKIPGYSSVAAQNNIAAHLSQRNLIYVLPNVENAEYIIVDLHKNQSEYNFSPGTSKEIEEIISELTRTGKYQIMEQLDQSMLLKKVNY